jgi:hypothetical protein
LTDFGFSDDGFHAVGTAVAPLLSESFVFGRDL